MLRPQAGIQVDKFYPPTDWLDNNNKQIDIRKGAENNSIVLLVGHSADFTKYSLLGLYIDTSLGTYDVYIDDVLVGSGISKNTQYDIDFSTINTSYGSATTPESLVLHKVVIKPTTSGEKIVAFHCVRTSGASGQQAQGILWCHFELINVINFVDLFYYTGYKNTNVLGLTAKNNELNCGNNISYALNSTQIQFVPLLKIPNNTTFFYLNTSNTKLKREIIKGGTVSNQYGLPTAFYGNSNLEQVIIDSDTSNVSSSTNVFENDIKLKKIPIKDYISATNMGSFITNAQSLYPTKLDVSKATNLTKIGSNGTSNISMRGLRGLKVSNEAPFTGASPQIDVSYTGLDRDALVELFQSLPTVTNSQTLKCVACSGNNLTKVGSPAIDENGVVSGFDDSNRIDFKAFAINDYYELGTKIVFNELPSSSVTVNIIGTTYLYSTLGFKVYGSTLYSAVRYLLNGSRSTVTVSLSNFTLQTNITYFVKLIIKDKKYQIFISTDKVNWLGSNIANLPDGAVILNPQTGNNQAGLLRIGGGTQYSSFNGSIWIEETYAKTDTNYLVKGYLLDTDKAIATDKGWGLVLS